MTQKQMQAEAILYAFCGSLSNPQFGRILKKDTQVQEYYLNGLGMCLEVQFIDVYSNRMFKTSATTNGYYTMRHIGGASYEEN